MTPILSFETGGDQDEPIGDLGDDEYGTAESFQLDADYNIDSIEVYIKKVGTITDNITVRIETDTTGPKPSGTLVSANATTTIVTTDTNYGWIVATFPVAFKLDASTKYWIVCTVPAQTTNNSYKWFRDNGNGYADGGQATKFNGTWGNESATADVYFRINGTEWVGTTGNFFALL